MFFKPYNPASKGEINSINCQHLTGYDVFKLIGLSGIYAILPKEDIETIVLEGIYPNPKLTILAYQTKLHIEIELIIDENRIHNELIIIGEDIPGDKNGLKVFRNQIKKAIAADFKFITLEAATGYYEDGTPYVGYKVWQKFGYTMIAPSQILFEEFMQRESRTETTLLQLLSQSTPEEQRKAEKLWEKIAFTWMGIFDLAENSPNQIILKSYLDKRGLN